jgi:phosphatidylethanolamine-binding protein (PEBP) family uncharacterized protein
MKSFALRAFDPDARNGEEWLPQAQHCCLFTIYALDIPTLAVDEMNLPADVMAERQKQTIGKASIRSYDQH